MGTPGDRFALAVELGMVTQQAQCHSEWRLAPNAHVIA